MKICASAIKPVKSVKFQGKWIRKWKFEKVRKCESYMVGHDVVWVGCRSRNNWEMGGRLDFKIPRSRWWYVVAYVSRPTHPLYTGYIPWSAIHQITFSLVVKNAWFKIDKSKILVFFCALSPCNCSVQATQSKGLRAKALRAKRVLTSSA